MSDSREGGFNWIAGADALPMLGGKVEECHEFGPILLLTQRSLGVFGLIYFDEQIERLLRIIFGLSLPDIGPVAYLCRSKCSFKPPFVQKRPDFSSPKLSAGAEGYRTR